MPEPLAPLLDRLPDGVRCAALPTPFAVGPVNCYLLPEPPVTVIDPGMYLPESLRDLDELLAANRIRMHDIEIVVVTHAHPDHFGAAAHLARESGASIVCGRQEVRKLCMEHGRVDAYRSVLDALGFPEEARELFPALLRHVGEMVLPADPAMIAAVDDGDTLDAGGRRFDVHVTPGHAAGHVSLFDESVLFSGDHLLPRISPNPFLELAEGEVPDRRRSLVEYLASLDRFAALDPASVLPGHGEPFTDVGRWAKQVRSHHARRAQTILAALTDVGRATAFELTERIFPELDGFTIVLGVSEIVGHLDLLEQDALVGNDGGIPQYWSAR